MNKKTNSKKKSQQDVHIKSKFIQSSAVNTSSLINSLGNIASSATGILANDLNLANLTDMFRLYRINRITFEFMPATLTGGAAVQVPAAVLAFTPFGAGTPTSLQDFESPLVSEPSVSFPTQSGAAYYVPTRDIGTKLSLSNSDMPVLQGPGGGWLATQDDGTQTSWGKLFWALASATAANAMTYLLTTHFDMSFKDLLDPSLISSLMARHPMGLPSHITALPGSPLDAAHQYQVKKWSSLSNPSPSAFIIKDKGFDKACNLTSLLLKLSESDLESVQALVSRLTLTAPTETPG